MTSPPTTSSHRNDDREVSVVYISSNSSSEDEEDTANAFHWGQGSPTDRRSIRELVREGKRLLMLAEARSRPEEYRSGGASVFKYNFSSSVTGCDLFRDRELTELMNVAVTLQERLSAEKVFSLGLPQLRSERDVFDELIMRFADELLDISSHNSTPNNAMEHTATEPAPVNGLVPAESDVSGNTQNLGNGMDNSNVGENSGSSNLFVNQSHQPTVPTVTGVVQSGHVTVQRISDGSGVSTCSIHPKGVAAQGSLNMSALQEFFRLVGEIQSVTQLQEVGCSRSPNLRAYELILAIQSSLSSAIGGTTAQTPISSPWLSKRRRSEDESDGSAKKPKIKEETNKEDDEDKEEDSCSICMEPWSTGGEHRVTCLKCGHLFGLSCIIKWVEQAHCCPQCKAAAKKSDLRHLFVSKISAEDTSQRDRAMRLLEEEKIARRSIEQKEAMVRRKLETQAADIEALRAELTQLKSQLPENGGYSQRLTVAPPNAHRSESVSNPSVGSKSFQMFQKVNISQDGTCRVFDHCKQRDLLVVSQKSTNSLFRGYGIRILTRDFKPLSYQPLHSAAIRDMSFRPGAFDGMLLSCGMDKCLQLTSVTGNVVIHKYTVSSMVWCCAWNTQNTNMFYAGMEKGVVKEFDIRRIDSHVQDVLDYGGGPISSIQYWSGNMHDRALQGLLIAHQHSVIFGEHINDQFTVHQLPRLQAPSMSLSLHPSGKFLTSFRPGTHNPKCKYEICNLYDSPADDGMPRTVSSACQAVWEGSNMQAVISRNSLITKPDTDNNLLAVTANHSNNTISVWDFNNRKQLQTLPCFDKAIDIKPLYDDMLGVLTYKDLVLYNWK